MKQNKVDVHGSLQGNSYMQWKVPGLHLALGPNSADVKGELGVKDLNLDTTIDAPHLDNALPGLGGTAKGLLKVRGTIDAPQLLADITARAFTLAGTDGSPGQRQRRCQIQRPDWR